MGTLFCNSEYLYDSNVEGMISSDVIEVEVMSRTHLE